LKGGAGSLRRAASTAPTSGPAAPGPPRRASRLGAAWRQGWGMRKGHHRGEPRPSRPSRPRWARGIGSSAGHAVEPGEALAAVGLGSEVFADSGLGRQASAGANRLKRPPGEGRPCGWAPRGHRQPPAASAVGADRRQGAAGSRLARGWVRRHHALSARRTPRH
jgi:hypothetical protein